MIILRTSIINKINEATNILLSKPIRVIRDKCVVNNYDYKKGFDSNTN